MRRDQNHTVCRVRQYPEDEKSKGFHPTPLITVEPDILQDFCREVITWKRLSHPNVLELIGVMMDDSGYSMVSPWMDNGSIVKFLKEGPEANPLKLARTVFRFTHPFAESGHS